MNAYILKTNNITDTRQKAYRPIDTSQPAGFWIEEPQYNKKGNRKTLCGNWQEDTILEHDIKESRTDHQQDDNVDIDMSKLMKSTTSFNDYEQARKLNVYHPRAKQTAKIALGTNSIMSVFREEHSQVNLKMVSTANNSKFLTSTYLEKDNFQSENRSEFYNRQPLPKLVGSRKKLRDAELLAKARELVAEDNEIEAHELSRQVSGDTLYTTTAKQFQSVPNESKVHEHQQADPITIYNQNDASIMTSKVVDGVQEHFGRNSKFSTEISETLRPTPIERVNYN